MSSDYNSKRLSAAIRQDAAKSGVDKLVGINETGSMMNIRVQELRDEISEKNLTHLLSIHAFTTKGHSTREEIRALERVLAEHELEVKAELEKSTKPILLMHTCFAFVTRMWEFAIVLLLAELTNNSLFIVSFSQFLSSFAIFSLSPRAGQWLDGSDRLAAMKSLMVWKVGATTMAYGVCMVLLACQSESSDQDGWICGNAYAIYLVPFTAAVAHLAFATAKMSLEKDWVVAIGRGDKEWLSSLNSQMTQIDLTCQSVAPAVTGVLYFVMSYFSVACMLLVINILASLCWFELLKKLYVQCPFLSVKSQNEETLHEKMPVKATKNILTSGCAGALISFSCLFLTVLSFGSIMIVYLRWSGLSDIYIGLARGLSALAGFSGALIYPYARKKLGLFRTGILAIWFQVLFVFIAAAGIYFCSPLTGCIIMIVAVLVSRAGLWLFDLCARQISQETIDEDSRGAINGQWTSLTSFFNFTSYLLACLYSDPVQFWVLTSVSFAMVLVAAMVFSLAYYNVPQEEDRKGYEEIPESAFELLDDGNRTVSMIDEVCV